MTFSKLVSSIAIAALCLFLTACEPKSKSQNPNAEVKETITIGVITPLTGNGAVYGNATQEGVNLAVSEINNTAGYEALKIIYQDDRMTAKDGISSLQRLIATDDPSVVIGPFGSSIVLAVAPLANKSETVIISASATADTIADAGDFVFRITPPNSQQGLDLAKLSVEVLGKERAAIVYQNNDYGQTMRDAFRVEFEKGGGEIIAVEGIQNDTTDFRPVITKLLDKNPDIVFFPMQSQEGTIFVRQAKELGLGTDYISGDGAKTPDFIAGAGPAAEGVYFSTLGLGYGVADAEIEKFQTAFRNEYGKSPDSYAPYYYDVTKLVYKAISEVGDDSKAVRDYFYALNGDNYHIGVTGKTTFDSKGEVQKPFYVFKVRDGKYVRHDE